MCLKLVLSTTNRNRLKDVAYIKSMNGKSTVGFAIAIIRKSFIICIDRIEITEIVRCTFYVIFTCLTQWTTMRVIAIIHLVRVCSVCRLVVIVCNNSLSHLVAINH